MNSTVAMSEQINRAQRLVRNWNEIRPFLVFNCNPTLSDRFYDEMEALREAVEALETQGADEEAWRGAMI
jgi:hypothetical protein